MGWVWFGEDLKNEISIPKNLVVDSLHTQIAPKIAKKWGFRVFRSLVGFGLVTTS